MNITVLLGNLTRDPELKFTPKGTAISAFSIAQNRTWKTEGGEKMEKVSFIECEAWGRTGEVIAEYFKKGAKILIHGRLDQETWKDKETQKNRSRLKVVVESFDFVDGRAGGSGSGRVNNEADAAGARAAAAQPASARRPVDRDLDSRADNDGIPF